VTTGLNWTKEIRFFSLSGPVRKGPGRNTGAFFFGFFGRKEMRIKHPNGADDQKRIQDLDRSRKLQAELTEERNKKTLDLVVEMQPEIELPF